MLFLLFRFNPCCIGLSAEAIQQEQERTIQRIVSILVVLD